VLSDEELENLLREGTPDHAVVSLVSASLDAGSSDNVTVVVADVVADDAVSDADTSASMTTGPMLVGAAAEAPRRRGAGAGRATRATDTGELDPVTDEDGNTGGEDLDPEEMRYAPRPPRKHAWLRRLAVLVLILLLVGIVAVAAYRWTQSQFYVADDGGQVAVFRGVEADVPGVRMHEVEEASDLTLDDLPTYNAGQVREGISADSLADARGIVTRLERLALCPDPKDPEASPSNKPSASPSAKPSAKPSKRPSASPSASGSPSGSASSSGEPSPGGSSVCTEAAP
jgi:hypothetical protein